MPQRTAHPPCPEPIHARSVESAATVAHPGDGGVAARSSPVGRRGRAATPGQGVATTPRGRRSRSGLARGRVVRRRARRAASALLARVALRRARRLRHDHRRGAAGFRGGGRSSRLRGGESPRRPFERIKANATASRPQLMLVWHRQRRGPVLGDSRHAGAQRDPRCRGDAVRHQRRRGDRFRPGVLHRDCTRSEHRRCGPEWPHRHPGKRQGNAGVGHAGALPAWRNDPAVRDDIGTTAESRQPHGGRSA